MALTSQISAYDAKWPDMFLSEKCRIEEAFGSELVQIHHVGSTAVPGLAAKPEIDLLVEVREHRDETRVAKLHEIHWIRSGKGPFTGPPFLSA